MNAICKSKGVCVKTYKDVKPIALEIKGLVSEVMEILKLITVMPASNAVSKQSFSALKRHKS